MIKDHLNKLIGLLILHRTHILSVDVDDIIIACADYYQEDVPHDYVSKIDAQVRCTLDALREYDCKATFFVQAQYCSCLLYTSPSPRDRQKSRMPSSA